jgi:predicted NAD-dependent protein-ADP-ribosyltransferase YbiA (DUF1768 family)
MPSAPRKHVLRNVKAGNFPKETCAKDSTEIDDKWSANDKHTSFIYFKAGVGASNGLNIALLSNLATVTPFEYKGYKFGSAENAYMAVRLHPSDRWRLSTGGDLGSFKNMKNSPKTMSWWNNLKFNQNRKSPINFWEANNMSGIIAKQATKEDSCHQLLLLLDQKPRPSKAEEWTIWREILEAKYRADLSARTVLVATGDSLLVEMAKNLGRTAKHGAAAPTNKWGGLVKDGFLLGENTMGRYMCRVRTILQAEHDLVSV